MAGAAAALVGTAAVIQNERSVDYDKMVQQSVELFIEELTVLMAIMTQGVPKKSDKLLSDVTKLRNFFISAAKQHRYKKNPCHLAAADDTYHASSRDKTDSATHPIDTSFLWTTAALDDFVKRGVCPMQVAREAAMRDLSITSNSDRLAQAVTQLLMPYRDAGGLTVVTVREAGDRSRGAYYCEAINGASRLQQHQGGDEGGNDSDEWPQQQPVPAGTPVLKSSSPSVPQEINISEKERLVTTLQERIKELERLAHATVSKVT